MKMTESQKSPRRRGVFAVTPCKWGSAGGRAISAGAGLCRCARHRLQPCHDLSPGRSRVGGARSLPALSWPLRYRLLCRAAGGGHYPGSRTGNLRLRRQPPADVRHGDLHPGMEMSGGSLGQGDCPSPSAWRSGCGRNRARPGSTTPCPMGSWTKGRPGRRRCRRLTMA